jgi:pimeloyl-ACP methyl ester carboxylesterase
MRTEKRYDAGSLKMNYAEGPANGTPLVLLHGITARWQEMDPLITELEHHWHVYACDLRGHGKSDRVNSYRVLDFFPDVVAFIQNCIGVPTVLVGHSLGALVSIETTTIIPDLIQKVILLDPPLYLREESIQSNYAYDYFLGVYNYLTKQRTAREVFSRVFPGIDDEGIQSLVEGLTLVDTQFLKTIINDLLLEGWDLEATLEGIVCPTLMLYGDVEKGGIVRDRDVEFFHKQTSNGEAIQIKDAGHLLQIDQPARVLELIAEFHRNKAVGM